MTRYLDGLGFCSILCTCSSIETPYILLTKIQYIYIQIIRKVHACVVEHDCLVSWQKQIHIVTYMCTCDICMKFECTEAYQHDLHDICTMK